MKFTYLLVISLLAIYAVQGSDLNDDELNFSAENEDRNLLTAEIAEFENRLLNSNLYDMESTEYKEYDEQNDDELSNTDDELENFENEDQNLENKVVRKSRKPQPSLVAGMKKLMPLAFAMLPNIVAAADRPFNALTKDQVEKLQDEWKDKRPELFKAMENQFCKKYGNKEHCTLDYWSLPVGRRRAPKTKSINTQKLYTAHGKSFCKHFNDRKIKPLKCTNNLDRLSDSEKVEYTYSGEQIKLSEKEQKLIDFQNEWCKYYYDEMICDVEYHSGRADESLIEYYKKQCDYLKGENEDVECDVVDTRANNWVIGFMIAIFVAMVSGMFVVAFKSF